MSLARAEQLRDLGRWDEAEAAYAEVLAADPDNDDARVGHGLMLVALGAFDTAIEEFDRVLARAPGHTGARYHRAFTCALLRRDDEARADLDRLLADGFTEWYVWADRGGLALRNGSVDAAVSDLREAERLAPDEPAIHLNLGLALLKAGHPQEAFAHLAVAADAGLDGAAPRREQVRRQLARLMTSMEVQVAVDELAAAGSPEDVVRLAGRRPALLVPEVVEAIEVAVRDHPAAAQPALRRRVEDLRRLASAVTTTEPSRGTGVRRRLADGASHEDAVHYDRLAERLTLLHRRGHHREAAELAPEIAELALRVFGERSVEFGLQLMNLATIIGDDGDWDAAEPVLNTAVGILVELDPGLLPSGLVSYANLLSNAGALSRPLSCTSWRPRSWSVCRTASTIQLQRGSTRGTGTRCVRSAKPNGPRRCCEP